MIPTCLPAAPIGRGQHPTGPRPGEPESSEYTRHRVPPSFPAEREPKERTSPGISEPEIESFGSREPGRVAVEAGLRRPPAGNGQPRRPVAESPRSRKSNATWAASSRASSPSSKTCHRSTSHRDAGAGARRFDREEAIGTVRGRLPPRRCRRSSARPNLLRRRPSGGCGVAPRTRAERERPREPERERPRDRDRDRERPRPHARAGEPGYIPRRERLRSGDSPFGEDLFPTETEWPEPRDRPAAGGRRRGPWRPT